MSKVAKSASIPVDTLHAARSLIMSACSTLQESHAGPQLDCINKNLEAISAHLGIHNITWPDQKCTYASALNAGIQHPTLAAILPAIPQPQHDM